VLGWDTVLYQASSIPAGQRQDGPANPFYSPTVPVRTATQVTGREILFPKGTVVFEGVINGQRQIVVPPDWDHMGGSVATWTLP